MLVSPVLLSKIVHYGQAALVTMLCGQRGDLSGAARRMVSGAAAVFVAGVGAGTVPAGESLRVWHESEASGYRFYASNLSPVPMTVQIDLHTLKNLAAHPAGHQVFVVPAASERLPLLSLGAVNLRRPNRFEFRSREIFGDYRSARHDNGHLYWLPFTHGTRHHVGQGYGGAFSHNEPGREYAIDFDMPEGTVVSAAREGIVAKVKDDSNSGGPHPRFRDSGNFVAVLHSDGSFAEYVHLAPRGARVKQGERVRAGETIGLSGNTGFSNGPHLHFQVSLPTAEGIARSIPTRFLGPDGGALSLEEGGVYTAFHPGKGPVPAAAARVEATDFAAQRAPVPATNRIETREEIRDGVVIVYLRNGYNRPKAVRLDFPRLENLGIEGLPPGEVVVDARSERFVALLRPSSLGRPYEYRLGWQYRDLRR